MKCKARRQKTFTGCWDCRYRKIKCDEATPECTPCRHRGFSCGGYRPILIWVAPNQKYDPGKRRVLNSHLTWQGHRNFDSATVDNLIAQCDDFQGFHSPTGMSAGPFSVFHFVDIPTLQSPPSDKIILGEGFQDRELNNSANFLFNHYSTHIAPMMMPFQDRRNPWKSCYPLMARSGKSCAQRSLLHAMLAQAAGNLTLMGCQKEVMSALTLRHYTLAISELRKALCDPVDFCLIIASILTLIMAEVYGGQSRQWKLHFNGAWNFITSRGSRKPWQYSEQSWLTAQSLCLLKIRYDTMPTPAATAEQDCVLDNTRRIVASVSSRPDFGFTAGATSKLMWCIDETTRLASKIYQDGLRLHQQVVDEHYHRLLACSLPDSQGDLILQLHHQIFQLGAIIYFHRSVLDSPPHALAAFLDELLGHLKTYRGCGGGYVTVWPVFMAAVEAYQERHLEGFREWLRDCDKMGVANRKDIREVIESVWQRRQLIWQERGASTSLGNLTIDWRRVMSERGSEVLLV